MTALYQALLGLGLLTAIVTPIAVATFPAWEWRVLCWLDRRRRNREARGHRTAIRRTT
jgi:hypothetical protein